MKRGGPPRRRTPMPPRRHPPSRGHMPPRTSNLPQVSTRKRQDGYTRAEQQVIRADLAAPWRNTACWVAIAGVCTGQGEHWHELVGAGQGGSRIDPANLCWSCDACNSHLERRPDRYHRGFKVRRHTAVPGAGGLVPPSPHPLALASRWT